LTSNNSGTTDQPRVILVGAMGAGKTTVGRLIAAELNWPYIDNDYEMSKMASLSMKQLSALDVPTLHNLEEKYLKDVLSRPGPLVAGAAASAADSAELIEALRNQCTIYLHTPLEIQKQRAGNSGVGRQGLIENAVDVIRERYERRDPRYRQVASLIVDTTRDPENDAARILEYIKASF
jgi:shikimate kinase